MQNTTQQCAVIVYDYHAVHGMPYFHIILPKMAISWPKSMLC